MDALVPRKQASLYPQASILILKKLNREEVEDKTSSEKKEYS